ncbi:NAD(P)/FAD-dependent oxidoreductase [Kiloniella laminariae]|uniref:NAD(P)/FAD-dependent oxidoreductase n=1 Tax=Kiloniella laminariae TaxID=454162 RepID=UPI000370A077|nr:NAD(P)/FAD-dependent oxidoreductase [Kiloniella laminariae]
MQSWDVIIIGAGAAGLMCAIEAGKRGRKVLILDHASKLCEKIRISGGGRCNFTNIHTTAADFLSNNRHFAKSALARYTPRDFLDLVEKHGIKWHEKTLGQLFCDNSAQDIIDLLLAECRSASVTVKNPVTVKGVRPLPQQGSGAKFSLESSDGPLTCNSLVIATGGLSIPKIGATDFGHRIAKQFGVPLTPLRPALVPLTLNEADKEFCKTLSGVSQNCIASVKKQKFQENLLFTHRGLSGPAILQISSYWEPGKSISINLLPDQDIEADLVATENSKKALTNVLAPFMSKRFAQEWVERKAENRTPADLGSKKLHKIAEDIHNWIITPAGDEGYAKAEVTLGGVDTKDLSSATMESKTKPGLFFIGEVMDVTGHLGGFNFQWAWACGHAAGQAV